MFLNNYRNILNYILNIARLYINLTTSMCLTLSICVLFISLAQSVNEAQFLNTTSLPFFGYAGASTCTIVIVPSASIYGSL